jgi:hypothetical protein
MTETTFGNALVLLVLLAGVASIGRGLWMMRSAPRNSLLGEAGEPRRQRCMAWVVAGCMFLSIPALVGYVASPPETGPATVVVPAIPGHS